MTTAVSPPISFREALQFWDYGTLVIASESDLLPEGELAFKQLVLDQVFGR